MLFVDGENLTLRAQELAKRESLTLGLDPARYLQDVFVWNPQWDPVRIPRELSLFTLGNEFATRAYYYTSVTGDNDKVLSVRQALRSLGFDPMVFKKVSGTAKSKGVDIALTKDMLSHAFLDHYEDALLVAGDGDYIPLIEEVKRRGKRVSVAFFEAGGLGLAHELPLVADRFVDLSGHFIGKWRDRIELLEKRRRAV
jgi:uncharacterized LabA/DUF88 family protein